MHTIAPASTTIDIRIDVFVSMNDPNIIFRLNKESIKKSKHASKSRVQLSFMKDSLRNALALSSMLSALFLPAYAAYATRTTPPVDNIAYTILRSCREVVMFNILYLFSFIM